MNASTRAVFFDVDFTLHYPGPAFQGGATERSANVTDVLVKRSGDGSAPQIDVPVIRSLEELAEVL